jgi:DNA-binding NarL/FixJ family response regulator
MRPLRILIAEDHVLMVEAIRFATRADEGLQVVAAVEAGGEVVEAVDRHDPDVVLLDLNLPGLDGIEVLHALRAAGTRAKVVVLSAYDSSEVVERAFLAGAAAFITKRIDPGDLPAALRQAVDQTLFQPFRANPLLDGASSQAPPLSDRERDVLAGLAEGLSNRQIAERLCYAEQTVKLELTHIYRKFGVSSRSEALAAAFKLGLVARRSQDATLVY